LCCIFFGIGWYGKKLHVQSLIKKRTKSDITPSNGDSKEPASPVLEPSLLVANSSFTAGSDRPFIIMLNAEGFNPSELQIKSDGQDLRVIGCKSDSTTSLSEFRQSFRLPSHVDSALAKSALDPATRVLTITVPPKHLQLHRAIPVKHERSAIKLD